MPGGPPGLQNRWAALRVAGGFDSRPPPPPSRRSGAPVRPAGMLLPGFQPMPGQAVVFHSCRGESMRSAAVLAALLGSATLVLPFATTAQAATATQIQFRLIQYNSPGTDTGSNSSLNAEFVTLKNTGTTSRDLTGWTVEDLAGHVYTFGRFTLGPARRFAFILARERTLRPTGTGAGAGTCGTTRGIRPSCTRPPESGKTPVRGVMARGPCTADLPPLRPACRGLPRQAARRRTSQTVTAMSSTDSASSQPPSIHWKGQKRLPG